MSATPRRRDKLGAATGDTQLARDAGDTHQPVGTHLQVRPGSPPGEPLPEHNRKRRPRLEGFDYVGREVYHITLVTHQRQLLLTDRIAELTCDRITSVAETTAFDVLAYCVMPDHCHILLQGTSDAANLLRYVKAFKQTTSYAARRDLGEKHLWQQSFHDRVLRRSEDVHEVAKYVVENPVVAALADDSSDWPYSGGSRFMTGRAGTDLKVRPYDAKSVQ